MKAGFYIVCQPKHEKSTIWKELPFLTKTEAEKYIETCVKRYGYERQDLSVEFYPKQEN